MFLVRGIGKISNAAANQQSLYKFGQDSKGIEKTQEVRKFELIAGNKIAMKAISWKDLISQKYMQ